jgi:hypothetical protein
MLPSWLDGGPAKEFGNEIANDIRTLMPVGTDPKAGKKNLAKRLQKVAADRREDERRERQAPLQFLPKSQVRERLALVTKGQRLRTPFHKGSLALILARM